MGDLLRAAGKLLILLSFIAIVACSCGGGSTPSVGDPQNEQQLGQPGNEQQEQPAAEQPAAEQPAAEQSEQPAAELEAEPEPEPEPSVQTEPQEVEIDVDGYQDPGGDAIGLISVDYSFTGSYCEPNVKLTGGYGDPSMDLPIDLDGVTYLNESYLNEGQRSMLSQNGFVVTPDRFWEFHDLYEGMEPFDQPVFVTVDSLLHVYHLVFDKTLRDLEDERFYATMVDLTQAMESTAREQYIDCKCSKLAKPAHHAWAYFVVARQLLEEDPPPIPTEVTELVHSELELIDGQGGYLASPVMSIDPEKPFLEDYSQYIPRGHYTRTEQRQRYFKTMMWYGRLNMRLKVQDETLMALLITRAIHAAKTDSQPATTAWSEVYDPTAFLVGNADDLGVREYTEVARGIYGDELTLVQLADEDKLDQFIAAAYKLPPPRINSLFVLTSDDIDKETMGFRFMGQRFVLDGYIFQQLAFDRVEGRMLPNGLDVLAALGNDEAYTVLDELGETGYGNYDSQMQLLRDDIAGLELTDWTQNVYFCWLYCLDGVAQVKDAAFPPFMRTSAWARKDLHTALGSWAELKHDTILYAKQPVYPGSCPPGEVVVNWVEPNPLAYARLYALADLTQSGMSDRGLLSAEINSLLDSLKGKLETLQRIAEQELAGEQIAEIDNMMIKDIGSWLESMVNKSSDTETEYEYWWEGEICDEPAAIIADVATNALTGEVLEVGTGRVFNIYVVIPDGYGGLQLARGGVYSYYEFTWPIDDRLTDEKWRGMLTSGQVPDRPSWTTAFIVE